MDVSDQIWFFTDYETGSVYLGFDFANLPKLPEKMPSPIIARQPVPQTGQVPILRFTLKRQ